MEKITSDNLKGIPVSAQWLEGEESGSWYFLQEKGKFYEISRFSKDARLECKGLFGVCNEMNFDIKQPFQFTFLSHCQQVTIIQNGNKVKFARIEFEKGADEKLLDI